MERRRFSGSIRRKHIHTPILQGICRQFHVHFNSRIFFLPHSVHSRRPHLQARRKQSPTRHLHNLPPPSLRSLSRPHFLHRQLRQRRRRSRRSPPPGQAPSRLHPWRQSQRHLLHGRLRQLLPSANPPPRLLSAVRTRPSAADRLQGRIGLLQFRGSQP